MTLHLNRKSFTVQEYHQLAEIGILKESDRVELLYGDIVTISPTKSAHAGMVDSMIELLIIKLYKKANIKCQNPISLDKLSEPEPDIAVVKYKADGYSSQHPGPEDIYLVIEVADSSLEKDRQVKGPLYAKAGIPEYWIINLSDRQIEIHREPKDGAYCFQQTVSEGGRVESSSVPLSLIYADIFK
ncbi:MAG: Uma2 family endonuclease [Bacteroidota bacterium]